MIYPILIIILVVLIVVIIVLYNKLNNQNSGTGRALHGTNTVVINVSLDASGIPQQNYKQIELLPGQNALFAGPDEFSIIFKNRKTPNKKIENQSVSGVVAIEIPQDIFENSEFSEEFRKNGFIKFDYGIHANGKELDPPMIITRRN